MSVFRTVFTVIPLLLVTAPASATYLIQEDFDDGVADDFTPLSGYWYVEDGTYNCLVKGTDVAYSSYAGGTGWIDYSFRGRMLVDGGITHVLRFRSDGGGNGYELGVRGGSYQDVWLFKWVDGQRDFLAFAPHTPFADGVWHDFEVLCLGGDLAVRWDGVLILEHTDSDPHLGGGIELVAFVGGGADYQLAHYDEIAVESLTTASAESSWGAVKALF